MKIKAVQLEELHPE